MGTCISVLSRDSRENQCRTSAWCVQRLVAVCLVALAADTRDAGVCHIEREVSSA